MLSSRIFQQCYNFAVHTKVCIIGGGTGGVSVASHLIRNRITPSDIRVFDPSEEHYYQPGWTMVGANLTNVENTANPMSSVVPRGVALSKLRVNRINAAHNTV